MTNLKVACIQLSVGPNPTENLPTTLALIDQAAATGAQFIVTPEATNYIRSHAGEITSDLTDPDPHIDAFAAKAKEHQIWLMAGSLLLASPDLTNGPQKVNRQFLWGPDGQLVSTYDKIHMFDVQVGDGQIYKESEHYQAGNKLVKSNINGVTIGHAICYDLRFSHLFQQLALAGSQIIVVPAAFTALTGAAHWHILLRARAIENGVFIVAPGQTGEHQGERKTYGHSLIISPFGEVLADAGDTPNCIISAEINLDDVARTRGMIPNLKNLRDFSFDATG